MSYRPTWKERVEDAKARAGPAMAVVILLAVGGWAGWKLTRPKPPTPEALPAIATTPAVASDNSMRYPEAEMLHTQYEVAHSLAVAADARGSWDEALKAYGDARTALASINEQFPKSSRADAAALERLDAEITAAAGQQQAAAVGARLREAEAAVTARQLPQATEGFARALEAQHELNGKFPKHPQAGAAKIEALVVRRDNALSTPLLAELTDLDREIALLLGSGDIRAASEKMAAAGALIERLDRTYPRSTVLTPALRQKVEFLGQWRALLDTLHQQIYAQLAPLPGSTTARILKTEASQEIYSRLMNQNQSRNAGKALPVEAVSWHEAREFCTRLGWLLGARVRLPTEIEFRAAVIAGVGEAWSRDVAGGRSHEVGVSKPSATGLYDLLGNVAEWLDAPIDDAQARVAGGSYLDDGATLKNVPMMAVDKRERVRHIGFRFIVERTAN